MTVRPCGSVEAALEAAGDEALAAQRVGPVEWLDVSSQRQSLEDDYQLKVSGAIVCQGDTQAPCLRARTCRRR